MVVFSEVIAKMACLVLWDAYDAMLVWYMNPVICTHARKLYLAREQGSLANKREFLSSLAL